MTTAANIYCTIEDVEDILSSVGVSLATDDSSPSSYGAALAKAGNKIDFYLGRRYKPESLARSDMVKDWAALLAAWYIRNRRGDPPPQGLANLYHEAVAEMELVRKGQMDITGIGVRRSLAPSMSVIRPTMRPFPRTVVEKSRSTKGAGPTEGYKQNADPFDAAGGNSRLDFVI